MEIKETIKDGFTTLGPIGDLDANSSIELDEHIRKMVEEGNVDIHIDGSGLNYISSAGLGVFISYLDEIKAQGGKMIFSNLSDNVFDVFELLGLNQIVTIVKEGEEVAPLFS
jgi:anti-sigma B factor antagonist